MNPGRQAIPALTGIRFLAAIHVVFFHYAPSTSGLVRHTIENGYLAVGLFFILSGFVLAYNYAGRAVPARRFWVSRFARIYPAYLAAFLLIAPAVAVRNLNSPLKFAAAGVAALSLMQSWIPGLALSWNGPGWSLSNEAFFYLLFPFLLPILTSFARRGLWMVCIAACAAALVPQMVLQSEFAAYFPLFRLAEFTLGAAVGLLFLGRPRASRWSLPAVAGALAMFAMFAHNWIPAGLRGAVAAPLFAAFVYALAANHGIASRWLSSRTMLRLGEASYAIYILQSPLRAYWLALHAPTGWAGFAVYITALIGVSVIFNLRFEEPARRWILSLHARVRYDKPEAVCSAG